MKMGRVNGLKIESGEVNRRIVIFIKFFPGKYSLFTGAYPFLYDCGA